MGVRGVGMCGRLGGCECGGGVGISFILKSRYYIITLKKSKSEVKLIKVKEIPLKINPDQIPETLKIQLKNYHL